LKDEDTMSTQSEKAARFLRLHVPGNPIVLVNAWDAISARIVESAGYPALATTSAGIAFLEGYPDGQRISRAEMLAGIARVCRAVDVPVTADLESGYGETVEAAMATARGGIDAGAIGLNFEDGFEDQPRLIDMELQCERISAIRRVADERGVALVVNARTDVFLNGIGPEAGRLDEALARGRRYREAGADCIFVPGVTDPSTIERLAHGIDAPLNILATAAAPSLAEMKRLGVARVILGARPMLFALAALRDLAAHVRDVGTFSPLANVITHAEANALLA
jgi:2-methylisocitrate lyase-like PEP mutase family enzyme